jgi:hypothetical protein
MTPTATIPFVPTTLQFTQENYQTYYVDCAQSNASYQWNNRYTLLDQYGSVMNAPNNITINMDMISDHCYGYSNTPYTITLLAGTSYIQEAMATSNGLEECPYDFSCTQYAQGGFYASNDSGLAYLIA